MTQSGPHRSLEPWWDRQAPLHIASLVEGKARGSSGVGSLFWVISVFQVAHEEVLIWVELPFVHTTAAPAPRASRCWRIDWRSACLAAIFALRLATAFAKSSSFHCEQILWTVLCIPVWVTKRD